MRVASVTENEIKLTIEAAFDYANHVLDGDVDARAVLANAGFSGAPDASQASLDRLTVRIRDLLDLFDGLADETTDADQAAARLNDELAELPIHPAIVDHGHGHHLHWTPERTKFDDAVVADILMALSQELCANGTARFGVCAADDCDHFFYDTTRNGSRRFCADPRCASRTHTADHRARKRRSSGKN